MPSNRSLKPDQEQDRRIQLSIRLPRWLVEWLKEHGNQGETIETALVSCYDLRAEDFRKNG